MYKYLLLTAFYVTSTCAASQELTLYFIPSPEGMDWSSPAGLAKSAFKNKISFKPRFMGHVFVELKCGEKHELTGMVGKNFDYLNQLLVNQRGLGVLYHSFDGRLEDKADIEKELNELYTKGGVDYVRYLLNENQCQRALSYLSEYRNKNVGRHYGLANRPRFGEGAGCSAFGASFPELLDILDQDMRESWSQSVLIPLELAGAPLTDQSVGLLKIMFHAGSWAQESEKHQKLTFWNPDRMYDWVQKKYQKPTQGYSTEKRQNALGVVIDKSHFPSPEGPIWLQQIGPQAKK